MSIQPPPPFNNTYKKAPYIAPFSLNFHRQASTLLFSFQSNMAVFNIPANASLTSAIRILESGRRILPSRPSTARTRTRTSTAQPLISSSSSSSSSTSLYQVLLVKETASPIEIDTAYRMLARRLRSDVRSDDRDLMEIKKAYEILSDPAARAAYDRSRRMRR